MDARQKILNRIYEAQDVARIIRNRSAGFSGAQGKDVTELANAVTQGFQAIAEALVTINTSNWRDYP